MVWNVLHGANDVTNGAEKVLKIIRETKPDIVLLQESYDINDDRPMGFDRLPRRHQRRRHRECHRLACNGRCMGTMRII